jgi:hypothetical protein
MDKSDLAYSLQIRLNKLDVVLQELEQAGKVKLKDEGQAHCRIEK